MFTFLDPGTLIDDDLQLVLLETRPGNPAMFIAPDYRFKMIQTGRPDPIGGIDLRIGNADRIVLYGGHIGYNVRPAWRGHRYASRAVRLLLPLAQRHGLNPLWITCNPDNIASRRTCEMAGGIFVEIVDLPKDNDMYRGGERQKCRYRFDLGGGAGEVT